MWLTAFTDNVKKVLAGVGLQSATEDMIEEAVLELENLLVKYYLASKTMFHYVLCFIMLFIFLCLHSLIQSNLWKKIDFVKFF